MSCNRHTPAAVIAAAALALVFVLPWLLPSTISPIASVSQAVGFNNRIAIVGLVLACIAMALVAYRSHLVGEAIFGAEPVVQMTPVSTEDRVDRRLVFAVVGLTLVMTIVVVGITRTLPFSHAGYFIDVILRTAAGGHPYSEIGFMYGPALLYGPLWSWQLLQPLGVGPFSAYYAWVVLSQVVGLLLTVYLLNRLGMSRRVRNEAFLVIGLFGLFHFDLGLNYTALRFLLPYACLMWVATVLTGSSYRWKRLVAPSAAVLITAAVTPEMSAALFAALFCVLVLQLAGGMRSSIAPLLAMVVAGGVMGVLWPRGAVSAFAGGAYNFPVVPGIPQIIFVATMLTVAYGVGASRPRDIDPATSLSIGWLALALVLVAPALGRADFGHIFWNGLGAILICTAMFDSWAERGALYIRTVGLVFVLAMMIATAPWYGGVFQSGVRSGTVSESLAIRAAELVGKPASTGQRVWRQVAATRPTAQEIAKLEQLPSLGFTQPLAGELGRKLSASDNLVPLYVDPTMCLSASEFAIAMSQLRSAQTLAIPVSLGEALEGTAAIGGGREDNVVMAVPEVALNKSYCLQLLWLPIELHGRNAVLDPTASFAKALRSDWREVERTDNYILMRRVR